MAEEVKNLIKKYSELNDVQNYRMVLDAAQVFLKNHPNGVEDSDDLKTGIELFRLLVDLTQLSALRQYENNYTLHNEILKNKILVFKCCIPSSHKELKGLTELLVGLKENELG